MTIGQSPRPDLLEPLRAQLPDDVEIIEVGALDSLTAATLPGQDHRHAADRPAASYPLTTRLRDGTRVTLDEADLTPLVQGAVERGEEAGAAVSLLLCAGGFLEVTARGPLVRPFDAAVGDLRALGARRIAVLVPFEAQAGPSARKWSDAGFDPVPIVGDPLTLAPAEPARNAPDAVVLDYVGHSSATVAALRGRLDLPVVDLGESGADAAARHFDHHGGTPPPGAS